MKVIVAGSRNIKGTKENIEFLKNMLAELGATEVISGCANGADKLGELVAKSLSLPVKRFPADWDKHGKAAGYLRNAEMAEYGEALVYIQKDGSRGTQHMIDLAEAAKLIVKGRLVVGD